MFAAVDGHARLIMCPAGLHSIGRHARPWTTAWRMDHGAMDPAAAMHHAEPCRAGRRALPVCALRWRGPLGGAPRACSNPISRCCSRRARRSSIPSRPRRPPALPRTPRSPVSRLKTPLRAAGRSLGRGCPHSFPEETNMNTSMYCAWRWPAVAFPSLEPGLRLRLRHLRCRHQLDVCRSRRRHGLRRIRLPGPGPELERHLERASRDNEDKAIRSSFMTVGGRYQFNRAWGVIGRGAVLAS